MDQREIIKLVQVFKEKITGIVNYDNIFLYGSFAKGNQRKHSDIDIAVVVENCGDDYMELVQTLWKISDTVDSRIEPILLVKSQDIPGFYDEIVRTGILIN